MPIIDAIPAERLALLDTALLYHGSHHGSGGPDCKHCARELLHEVVTGKHRDATPPGVTLFVGVLPGLNDSPYWRDDTHRTVVMRPYLKRFLALDPAHDTERVYALVDHAYRKLLPDLCDALQLPDEAAKLRALAPIVDRETAEKARARDLARARALDLARDRALARDLDLARALDLARDSDLALALARARDLALALDRDLDPEQQAKVWEQAVREMLDLICGIE